MTNTNKHFPICKLTYPTSLTLEICKLTYLSALTLEMTNAHNVINIQSNITTGVCLGQHSPKLINHSFSDPLTSHTN